MSDERDAWIALASADRVGPATFARLLAAFGSARAVLDAAQASRLPAALADLERAARGEQQRPLPAPVVAGIATAALDRAECAARVRRLGVEAVTWPEAAYPERLRGLDDAPPVLFVRGSVVALSVARSVAVVGTRRPTPAGRSLAGDIGAAIARCGAAVVSGLAFGIDAAAHAAAVDVPGVTVAVIGSGQGAITPAAHRPLAETILQAGGAVVSELATDARPTEGTYPRRNRLIAGLAEAVVVVEAPGRSGALNTAHWAAALGRELYAAPGRPWEPTTAGCLALLHDVPGCRPVVSVPRLLDDLGLLAEPADVTKLAMGSAGRASLQAVLVGLSKIEALLARELRDGPASPDRLAVRCGLPVEQVASGLSLLELRGYAWSSGPLYVASGALRDAS